MEDQALIEAYINTCEKGSPGERFRAQNAILDFQEKAIPALLKAIGENRAPHVMETCIWALGQIGHLDQDVTDKLVELSKHPDSSISSKATFALFKIQNDEG